jgi:hypothetical protein
MPAFCGGDEVGAGGNGDVNGIKSRIPALYPGKGSMPLPLTGTSSSTIVRPFDNRLDRSSGGDVAHTHEFCVGEQVAASRIGKAEPARSA